MKKTFILLVLVIGCKNEHTDSYVSLTGKEAYTSCTDRQGKTWNVPESMIEQSLDRGFICSELTFANSIPRINCVDRHGKSWSVPICFFNEAIGRGYQCN